MRPFHHTVLDTNARVCGWPERWGLTVQRPLDVTWGLEGGQALLLALAKTGGKAIVEESAGCLNGPKRGKIQMLAMMLWG